MNRHSLHILCMLGLGLGALLFSAGCIGLKREVSSDRHGTPVTTAKLAQVEQGDTTREDIVKAFGPPTQSYKLKGNREILVYVQEQSERTETKLMLIFTLFEWESEEDKDVVRYVFEFEDDILVDHRVQTSG